MKNMARILAVTTQRAGETLTEFLATAPRHLFFTGKGGVGAMGQ
jgi:hypothetical protein